MKRILVSGFEAFGGAAINPTARLCAALAEQLGGDAANPRISLPAHAKVRPVLLPVTFDQAYEKLKAEIDAFDPHVVLSLGQAGGRDAIELERVAINVIDADIPDNSGALIQDRAVSEQGREAYFSSLPLRELLQALKAAQIPARISNTAGTYVCNFLFYRMMEEQSQSQGKRQRRCGFVHVPYLPEQVTGKPDTPSMPIETMIRALGVLIETLART